MRSWRSTSTSPGAVRSRAQQQQLVRAVHTAAAHEQETNYAECKSTVELVGGGARGRAVIAKAVLGFSNRDPDVAARAMGGCAYLLAGVAPGELGGVRAVDAATLEAQVAPYVRAWVQWRADYVDVDGSTVLVVTVEPPRWGDPLHPVRKAYLPDSGGPKLVEGAVYVRRHASTEQASAADIDMVSRRAARRPGDELALDVRPAPDAALHALDISADARGAYIAGERMRLLGPPAAIGTMRVPPIGALIGREPRSETDFRDDVERYLADLEVNLANALRARSVVHEVARRTFTSLTRPTAPSPACGSKSFWPAASGRGTGATTRASTPSFLWRRHRTGRRRCSRMQPGRSCRAPGA